MLGLFTLIFHTLRAKTNQYNLFLWFFHVLLYFVENLKRFFLCDAFSKTCNKASNVTFHVRIFVCLSVNLKFYFGLNVTNFPLNFTCGWLLLVLKVEQNVLNSVWFECGLFGFTTCKQSNLHSITHVSLSEVNWIASGSCP